MEEKQPPVATAPSDEHEVEQFLRQFDALPLEDRRAAMANVFGVDPSKAVVVRRPDGKLAMEEVSAGSRARIALMTSQGFQTASFTNRKLRRQAAARRQTPQKAASAR